MAAVLPSTEDFLARFPEFEEAGEERIALALGDAALYVSDDWIQDFVPLAVMTLAAHLLYSESSLMTEIQRNLSGAGGAGPIVSKTIGPLKIDYAQPKTNTSSSSGTINADDSPYGARFLQLIRMSFPSVLVVI